MGQLANVPGGNYAKFMDSFFGGQILDVRFSTKEGFSNCDANTLGFGIGVVIGIGAAVNKMARAPRLNRNTLTASTDLITGNSTIVTVNGNATTATVYTSSHANTMSLIVAKVLLLPGVTACSASGDVLTITMSDYDITASAATTAGSSQPTWTAGTASTVDVVKGITVYRPSEGTLPTPSTASVAVAYQYQDPMTVMHNGVVVAALDTSLSAGDIAAIVPDSNAYIVTAAGATRGQITNVSTNNLLIGKFRLDLDTRNFYLTGGVVPVEVNL